ncbi:MAG: hypothetical protein GY711_24330 [bacterium]|nr:hypothetical protein [bacterium]
MSRNSSQAPGLLSLLARLRERLARMVWLHGVGTVLFVAAAWLLLIFLADWLLHLPAGIRVVHSLAAVALPIFFFRRDLVRLLPRIPDRAGLAMMLERKHPETSDLLVSAVQLAPQVEAQTAVPGRELIERVIQDAEAQVRGLDVGRVIDANGPRRRMAAGVFLSIATTVVFAVNPTLSGIFFQRMFGANVPWPQRTLLSVEIPVLSDRAQLIESQGEILVRAARGSDIPVLVRAEGVIPSEVILHFASGHKTPLPSGGTPLFRTLLRSVQEDIEFYVTGGDDERGEPLVRVQVLQPPDVSALAFRVEPPAYSGRPTRLEHDTDVEVLQGTRVTVFMLPDPVDADGVAHVLPEDREFALTRVPFPAREGEEARPDGAPAGEGLSFELVADASLRFRYALSDDTGLPNPDPGLYAIQVIDDKRPEIVLLAPGRAEIDVVAGGAVPLRVRFEDDFGIEATNWDVRPSQDPDQLLASGELATRPIEPGPEDSFRSSARVLAVGRARLEVDTLGGEMPLLEGQQVVLQVVATDNRTPDPGEAQSAPVRLRVVSGDEFLRRLKDQLARASEQAGKLSELAESEQLSTVDTLGVLDPEMPAEDASAEIGSLMHGARRIQGDSRALARDLSEVTESVLYARVDDRSGPLLEAIDGLLEEYTDKSFHAEPWAELQERYAAGQLGQADLAGDLVELVGLAVTLGEDDAQATLDALARAQAAEGPAAVRTALTEATQAHARARETLDKLLVKLGEWDNFQSVLTLTRDILNRQKNLLQRTRKYAEDN